MSATVGKPASHGAASQRRMPSKMSPPNDGVGGCAPRPKMLRTASMPMISGNRYRRLTDAGATPKGSSERVKTVGASQPSACSARTKGACEIRCTSARTIRAGAAQTTPPMIHGNAAVPDPRTAAKATTRRKNGVVWSNAIIQPMRRSGQRPTVRPAIPPRTRLSGNATAREPPTVRNESAVPRSVRSH